MHLPKLLKFAFIFIALGLTIFLFSQNNDKTERMAISQIEPVDSQLKKTRVADVASTTMHSPRFSGEDNKNRKWLITAKQARQSGDIGNEEVFLEEIKAQAVTSKGKELSFIATEGFYSHKTEALTLQKNIKIEGYGFIILTDNIIAFLKKGSVSGNKNVEVVTDTHNLRANSFSLQENGEKISFAGDVKSTQEEMQLTSQKLDIFFKNEKSKDSSSNIDKIIAEEKVTLKRQKDVVTGDKATYTPYNDEIILTGNVVFVRDKNVLKGDKLIYNAKTGKTNLSSDNVSGTGRIKAQLVPNEKEK
jgi:lipopolysaccharide export system protein LptA